MSRVGRIALILGLVTTALATNAWAQPAFEGFIESDLYPIRLHWAEGVEEETAQRILGYAEASWQRQVEQMGFPVPTTQDDEGNLVPGLYVYVDPDGGYNTSEPIADNPDTPWTDCAVRMLIASVAPESFLEVTTWHEMNHAFEMSSDCAEAFFAFEQTTVAATTIVFPEDEILTQYFLPTFQQNPHLGLACTFFWDEELAYFHFGGSLFQVFLEDRHGQYDGRLLSSIWEAAKQDGSILDMGMMGPEMDVPNDPDLMEAIATVLAPTTLEEAFAEFARWRYFVGVRDDGAHFRDGALWGGSELELDTSLALSDLPVEQGTPNHSPDDLGSAYLDLSLFGIEPNRALHFSFAGDPDGRWHVDALLVRADGTADMQEVALGEDGTGEIDLPGLEAYADVVFVASNLGPESFDANDPLCDAGLPFTYGLELRDRALPPTLIGVDPSELEVGSTSYVWVTAEGLVDGLEVSFGGDGIQIESVETVDATTLGIDLTVSDDAALGARSLTVTNPGDAAATLQDAIRIVAPPGDDDDDPPVEDETSSSGCSCSVSQPAPSERLRSLGALLVLVAALGRRRRGA